MAEFHATEIRYIFCGIPRPPMETTWTALRILAIWKFNGTQLFSDSTPHDFPFPKIRKFPRDWEDNFPTFQKQLRFFFVELPRGMVHESPRYLEGNCIIESLPESFVTERGVVTQVGGLSCIIYMILKD